MGTEVLIAGAVIQGYGQIQAAKEARRVGKANAAYYREQKEMQELAARRELDIFEHESEMFMGSQVSAFAKSGVSLSGSMVSKLAGDRAAIHRESNAIREGNRTKIKLTEMRANEEDRKVSAARRALPMQLLGTGLNAYVGTQQMQKNTLLNQRLEAMRTDALLQTTRMTTLPANNFNEDFLNA